MAGGTRPDLKDCRHRKGATVGLVLAALLVFHLAWSVSALGFLFVVWAAVLTALAGRLTLRAGFYLGLLLGVGWYAPHLWFFTGLFGLGGARSVRG